MDFYDVPTSWTCAGSNACDPLPSGLLPHLSFQAGTVQGGPLYLSKRLYHRPFQELNIIQEIPLSLSRNPGDSGRGLEGRGHLLSLLSGNIRESTCDFDPEIVISSSPREMEMMKKAVYMHRVPPHILILPKPQPTVGSYLC